MLVAPGMGSAPLQSTQFERHLGRSLSPADQSDLPHRLGKGWPRLPTGRHEPAPAMSLDALPAGEAPERQRPVGNERHSQLTARGERAVSLRRPVSKAELPPSLQARTMPREERTACALRTWDAL